MGCAQRTNLMAGVYPKGTCQPCLPLRRKQAAILAATLATTPVAAVL